MVNRGLSDINQNGGRKMTDDDAGILPRTFSMLSLTGKNEQRISRIARKVLWIEDRLGGRTNKSFEEWCSIDNLNRAFQWMYPDG